MDRNTHSEFIYTEGVQANNNNQQEMVLNLHLFVHNVIYCVFRPVVSHHHGYIVYTTLELCLVLNVNHICS
jgi:hypothetical protein